MAVTIPAGFRAEAATLNLAAELRLEVGANLNLFAKDGGTLNIAEDAVVRMVGGDARIIFNNNTFPLVPVTPNVAGGGAIQFESTTESSILTVWSNTPSDRLFIGAQSTIRAAAGAAGSVVAPNVINAGIVLSDLQTASAITIGGNTNAPAFTNRGVSSRSSSTHADGRSPRARRPSKCSSATVRPPTGATPSGIIWTEKGPWKEIIVYKEEVQHNFPKPHTDVLEQVIEYEVPADKFDELAEYDGSVIVERTKGTMAARCVHDPL